MSGHSFIEAAGAGIVRFARSSRSEITRRLLTSPNASQVAGPTMTSKLNNVISAAAIRRRPPSSRDIHSKTG